MLRASMLFNVMAVLLILPNLAAAAEDKGTYCTAVEPQEFVNIVLSTSGVSKPTRCILFYKSNKLVAEFNFWNDKTAPSGLPKVKDNSGVFEVETTISQYSDICDILREEEEIYLGFECDGAGGYKGYAVGGTDDADRFRAAVDTLIKSRDRVGQQ